MASLEKKLRLYETTVLKNQIGLSGISSDKFQITTGARLVFSLQVSNLTGTSVTLKLRNAFSLDLSFTQILQISATVNGTFSKVLTDFHNIFEWEIEVIGGAADVALGVSIFDNAAATRIENAVVETAISAYPGIDGEYDSVRVSDGVNEMLVRADKSINTNKMNTLVKDPFDKVVNTYDGEGNLTLAEYYFEGDLVHSITMTYDAYCNLLTAEVA